MTATGMIFLIVCVSFLVSAARGYSKATNVHQYFHVPGERRNVLSLGIADITLGTGVVYLLTAASQNGLSMLTLPAATALGYVLYAKFMAFSFEKGVTDRGNLLLGIRKFHSQHLASKNRLFDAFVTLPLVLVFLFVFAFEIFAGSAIISGFIKPGGTSSTQILVGGALFCIAFANCFFGGMQASYRNDKLLAVGIICLFALIILASLVSSPQEQKATGSQILWGTSGMNCLTSALMRQI